MPCVLGLGGRGVFGSKIVVVVVVVVETAPLSPHPRQLIDLPMA